MYRLLVLSSLLWITACADSDSVSATETEEPLCDGAAECALIVENAVAECGSNETPSLTGTATGSDVHVEHLDAAQGCCPALEVTATIIVERSSIDIDYDLSEDECACVCELDLSYTLTEVPVGDWTLVVDGVDDVQVMVRPD